jgi:predicted ATPase
MRKTSWAVITGAPCSGKTSVVSRLATMGFRVVPEAARAYIEEMISSGKSLEQTKADIQLFEWSILQRKIKIESNLPSNETIFLDRAIPDSIAYYKAAGLSASEPLEKSRFIRYRAVFHFERLRFHKDQVRNEDANMAETLDEMLRQSYKMLGYEAIEVPVMQVEKRADFILRRMQSIVFSQPR